METVTDDKEITALLVIAPYNDFISEGGKLWDRVKTVAEANECIPHMLQVLKREFDVMVGKENPVRYDSECYPHSLTEGVLVPGHRSALLRHRRLLLPFCSLLAPASESPQLSVASARNSLALKRSEDDGGRLSPVRLSHGQGFLPAFRHAPSTRGVSPLRQLQSSRCINAARLIPLCASRQPRKGHSQGMAFIASPWLAVCPPTRSAGHWVFAGRAGGGQKTCGWCSGFKLPLLINDLGERLACRLPPATVDDRRPVPGLVKGLQGKVCGERGSIAQALFADLFPRGVQLIPTRRKERKNKLLFLWDKVLLRKRSLSETVNDPLKHIPQIAHSRHRRVATFLVKLVAGLLASTHREKKPSLHLRTPQAADLSVLALSLYRTHVFRISICIPPLMR